MYSHFSSVKTLIQFYGIRRMKVIYTYVMACNNGMNYDGTESVNLNKITSLIRKNIFFFASGKLAKSEIYFSGFVHLLRYFVFTRKVRACCKFSKTFYC